MGGVLTMKKWSSILVFLMVIASFNTVSSAEEQQNALQEAEVTARVATYNIQAGSGVDGDYDIKRTASTIRDMDADVIGLQEIDVYWGERSNFENTIEQLADELDMEYFFAPIYDFDPEVIGEERRKYGVGILSKYPILKTENHEITRLSTQDPDADPEPMPGFLETQVDIEGAHVSFYVTHLDYRSDPSIREMQVAEMLEIMDESNYNILVGDLNAPPAADELNPLFNRFEDTWNAAENGDGYTFPADHPIKRIDYVLTSPRMAADDAQVHPTLASDHLPVMTDVTFVTGNHSYSVEGMKFLVDTYFEKGEIIKDSTAHKLNLHLKAIQHYEKQSMSHKLIKHLKTFKVLLDIQKEEGLLTENAYSTLSADANYLIDKWEEE